MHNQNSIEGVFAVIDSFAIISRNEFYLIGEITEGTIRAGLYANIVLNKSLNLTLLIKSIENIAFTNERARYKLIIVESDPESSELLLGLNIGSEDVRITIEGED